MMSGFVTKQEDDISAVEHGQGLRVSKRQSPATLRLRVIA
jgi:hypothetical protein